MILNDVRLQKFRHWTSNHNWKIRHFKLFKAVIVSCPRTIREMRSTKNPDLSQIPDFAGFLNDMNLHNFMQIPESQNVEKRMRRMKIAKIETQIFPGFQIFLD